MNLRDFIDKFGSAWVAYVTRDPSKFVVVADAYYYVEISGGKVKVTELSEPKTYKRVKRYLREVIEA